MKKKLKIYKKYQKKLKIEEKYFFKNLYKIGYSKLKKKFKKKKNYL